MPSQYDISRSDHASSFFVEDCKGDQQNLTYASLDRRAVPRYRPAGQNRLLGLAPNFRITSRSVSRLEVEDLEVDSIRKSRKQNLLANITDDDQASKIRPGVRDKSDICEDFLEFDQERPRKRRQSSPDALWETAEDAESDKPDSTTEDETTTHDAFDVFKKDPIHRRQLELSKATEERPHDTSAWLALINHQQHSFENDRSRLSSRNLTDLKISLYEQALSHVKSSDGRHALILGLMRDGRTLWDVDEQTLRWRAFLDNEASFDLWKLYVDFVQTSSVNYTFEGCLQVYAKWFQKFRDALEDQPRDSSCVYILLRLTSFLWQTGFTERAVGMWQALLEWNYFRPRPLQSEGEVRCFQEFWSSEVARLGEENSHGWCSDTNVAKIPAVDPSFQNESTTLEQWAAAEAELEITAGLAARSLDEISGNDPYRIVLFSDIQDFLFRPTSEEGRMLLVDAFLLFVGLPPLSSLEETSTWMGDPFIFSQSPTSLNLPQDADQTARDFGMSMRYEDVFLATKQACLLTPETLSSFPGKLLFSYPQFVRRVVSQLAELSRVGHEIDRMMEYAIAFEAGFDLKLARKQAKSFLKSKGDSLRLYDTFAMLEFRLGSFGPAERVWSTALSMRMSFDPDLRSDTSFLWRNWAYAYMCRGHFDEARNLISMLTVGGALDVSFDLARHKSGTPAFEPPSATAQIKVEQHLKQQVEIARSKRHRGLLRAAIDMLAFHHYLNQKLQLNAALRTYGNALTRFGGLTTTSLGTLEVIHEQRARFMYAHAAIFQKHFKPREVNALLSESVRQFPANLDLLLLQHYFSQRVGIMDRLRQVDSKTGEQQEATSTQSAIPCIFDVLTELKRPAYSGSTNHSIRSAFKRATEMGSPGRDSQQMWMAFVLWEVSLIAAEGGSKSAVRENVSVVAKERVQGTMATQAFYASLRACPWSKDLCMLAFKQSQLSDALGVQALKQVYHNMIDRGIRLHIDISDTLL